MRARFLLATSLLSLTLLTAYGCAESDAVDTSTGAGTTVGTGTTGGTGAGGGATTNTTTGTGTTTTGGGGEGGMGAGGDGGQGGQGGSDPCANGCLDGTWDIDGNPLTGTCGCEYSCVQTSPSDDPIDDGYTDDNCDGGDGLVEQCVYVSVSQGSDANTGTRMMPMQTIAAAIQQAQAVGVSAVCLSGEVYEQGTVGVASGISIYGGFDHNDPDFKFRRKANVITTVRAPGIAFDAPQINLPTHIQGITIEATSAGMPGASTIGVRFGGGLSELHVLDNIITVQAGMDGANGPNGMPHPNGVAPAGNAGQVGCDACSGMGVGGPQTACMEFGGKGGDGGYHHNDGQSGAMGSGNAPGGPGGVATDECAATSGSGQPGSLGATGNPGMPGAGGAALGTIMNGLYTPANGSSGMPGTNGRGGGGGGGGGGGSSCIYIFGGCVDTCNSDKGGGGGSGGCGGLGGANGTGGMGGGGSFGVLVASGTIIMTGNTMTTGSGGRGGNGGNGAAGQLGGQGGPAGGGADDAGGGAIGGNGGNGGAGGPGGGGGGGPSACLARGGGVTFTYAMNSCTTGLPGVGGDGGMNPAGGAASPGQNGTAAANLQIN